MAEAVACLWSEVGAAALAYLRDQRGLTDATIRAASLGDSPAAQAIPLAGVSAEDWVAYEQALAGLEPERRALVLMRYEFGMSYAEIALELQDTPDAVRMKVNRAIKALSDPGAGTQE